MRRGVHSQAYREYTHSYNVILTERQPVLVHLYHRNTNQYWSIYARGDRQAVPEAAALRSDHSLKQGSMFHVHCVTEDGLSSPRNESSDPTNSVTRVNTTTQQM